MKNKLFQALLIVLTCAGCHQGKPGKTIRQETAQKPTSGKLQTRLGSTGNSFTTDSIQLSFTVINNADTAQRFCKWETPFEPRLGKYFEIKDNQGNEPEFKGAMARRVMPPPAETYITVQAHDSLLTLFNLAEKYTVQPGTYSIKYSGGGVSGLDAGNEMNITIVRGH